MQDKISGLQAMLEPTSVAIIGASDDPARIGGRPLRYMRDGGFAGAIYPVNPNRREVQGIKTFASIVDVPEAVDCAIIAVPAKIVVATIEDCAKMGVKSVIIFSAGFAETATSAGEEMQAQLSDIAARTGLRILGPNCLGVLSFKSRFFATFSSTGDGGYSEPGPLAIISQSGAYGTHLYAVARSWGLGVAQVITTGNECDITVAECIGWAAQAPEVKIIAAYAEGIKDGPALIRSLQLARAHNKPVIFMKVGASEEGAAAAASHTASLAGADEIYQAVFNQHGVFRANTTEEMLDIAYACTAGIYPTGNKIGLVTLSGGVGVQMADHANKVGLNVAPMPEAAQQKLKAALPFAAPRNPVDTTAQMFNDLSLVGRNFTIMLEEGGYDVSVAFFTIAAASPYIVEPMLKELNQLRQQFPDRLIILSIMGPPDIMERYRQAGYLIFEDPCRAISAVAALVHFGMSFDAESGLNAERNSGALSVHALGTEALSEWASRIILEQVGIPVVDGKLATSAEQAVIFAQAFRAPVAMKINSADISHKTEIGGVELNISPANAGQVFERLQVQITRQAPDARSDGIIISPMVAGGIETILGITIDPVFGPAVMFGLGGIFVEVFQDVVFRLAPFDAQEALQMIAEIKGIKLLQGVRGAPPADINALADALVALSQFASIHADQLDSVDLNPFIVLPQGQGVLALDCLIVPKS
jgi:acetate---CoA ligase (ADP-forming)